MAAPITREELDALMQENLQKVSRLVDDRVEEALQNRSNRENVEVQTFLRGYKVYNATNLPVLAKGTMILLDLRPSAGASGVVAKYSSLGDRWVEEWAKQVNP